MKLLCGPTVMVLVLNWLMDSDVGGCGDAQEARDFAHLSGYETSLAAAVEEGPDLMSV
jgi:hypothetical protein